MRRRHFFGSGVLGYLVGLGLALVVAWVLWPTDYSNSTPADLRSVHRDDYIRMIAAKYMLDADLPLAQRQLAALGLPQAVNDVARLARAESSPERQQALIHLALDLQNPAAVVTRTIPARVSATSAAGATSVAPTPRPNLSSTPTLLAHMTLEPTPIAPTALPNLAAPFFRLTERVRIACGESGEGTIQVIVRESQGREVPGIAVEVAWSYGHETFYTGLKPERGLGLADYAAEPGTYTIRLTENARSDVVSGLQIDSPDECSPAGGTRGWKLVFAP